MGGKAILSSIEANGGLRLAYTKDGDSLVLKAVLQRYGGRMEKVSGQHQQYL